MSGLETLIPLLYHEKQQSGSQLCAQHALNAILQGDYFSAPDLAQFAQQLDSLEESVNRDVGPVSHNMDDTGFFSVQVLEGALKVWGFTLVRWRSQDLRDHQENPHSQMAFVLNHQQHWFTLRRFGALEDPNNGHWFNLNSFLQEPEWVGKLYLGMVLSQAEEEGYSVFAVLPTAEAGDTPMTLPRTDADQVAATLPQPTSSQIGTRLSMSRVPFSVDAASSKSTAPSSGFEDEDLELQAALQASLTGSGQLDYTSFSQPPSVPRTSSLSTPATRTFEGHLNVPEDPVATSMARNKAIMQRMRQEQELALREGYEGEMAGGFGGTNGTDVHRGSESSRVMREARSAGQTEEDDAIRKAIEDSKADGNLPEDSLEAMDVSENDGPLPQNTPSSVPTVLEDRVYDDEDSELQAALKASLEELPEGFAVPATPPRVDAPSSSRETNTKSETLEPEKDEEEGRPMLEIDAEEMRRRRLARFGGLQ